MLIPRDTRAAALLRRRTILTALYNARDTPDRAWPDALHAAAVAACGWPAAIAEEEALALNLAGAD